MAASSVKVKGLRELQRDFRKLDKGLAKQVRGELREAADIVRQEAASRFSDIDSRSAAGFKTRVRQRGAAVEQSRRRVTGKRGDYGALQMRRALVPALDDKQNQVVERLEKTLDRLAADNGF